MIPSSFLVHAAEQSGFGGVNRVRYLSKLKLFAEQIAQWEREQCAALCNERGHSLKHFDNEFMDGKMDGSFMCAELILLRSNDKTT